MKYRTFIGRKLLSHSIELLYTEGRESVCLIRPWDRPRQTRDKTTRARAVEVTCLTFFGGVNGPLTYMKTLLQMSYYYMLKQYFLRLRVRKSPSVSFSLLGLKLSGFNLTCLHFLPCHYSINRWNMQFISSYLPYCLL